MTRGEVLSFEQALQNKRRNPQARWPAVAESFAGEAWPRIEASFRLQPGDTVFTIGSCFARNIERYLADVGCRVPMLELHLPPDEWDGEANAPMNKFHPPAFRQSLDWAARIFDRGGRVAWSDCEPLGFHLGGDVWFDLDMGAVAPVGRARFLERRQQIYDALSTAFAADCLMMTPGLIEAWRDTSTGLYIHRPPIHKALAMQAARWEFEILSYEQCLADLLAAIDVVRARNPEVKVLITTSPVPMSATFSGQDIRIANAHSKAVLRAACGAAAAQRPMTDYFPSYESATLSAPELVWEVDRLHVTVAFVGKIVSHMLSHYLDGGASAALRLIEARTLLSGDRYQEAEAAARSALELSPEDADIVVLLAETLIRQGRPAEAEARLRPMITRHPERADLRTALGRAIAEADSARIPEAMAEIDAATALPSMGRAEFRSLARLIRRHAPREAALRLARLAAERFPLDMKATALLARVLIGQGRTAEAIEVLRQAVGARRCPASLRERLAQLLAKTGQTLEAINP